MSGKKVESSGKVREKSGNFIRKKKWEPCIICRYVTKCPGIKNHQRIRYPRCPGTSTYLCDLLEIDSYKTGAVSDMKI